MKKIIGKIATRIGNHSGVKSGAKNSGQAIIVKNNYTKEIIQPKMGLQKTEEKSKDKPKNTPN